MTNAVITQTAKYLPKRVVSNDELATLLETSDEWIYSRTGIKNRHVVTDETTSDLCTQVAKQLLEKSSLTAEKIDFIIVATTTPDFNMPSTACLVQGNLGLENALAFDISAACSGFVYALSMGEKFIKSGTYKKGLIIGGETLTNILDWSDRSTAVLFGDGAAGVLLEESYDRSQFLAEKLHSDGKRAASLTAGKQYQASPFYQKKESVQTTPSFLQMDGRSIFDFALRNVTQNILAIISSQNMSTDEVDYVLAHQANSRIIDAISKKTKITREKFLTNMEHYANTSAASIPILLHESIEEGKLVLGSKQKVVLTGFGGGLTWGSILLEL